MAATPKVKITGNLAVPGMPMNVGQFRCKIYAIFLPFLFFLQSSIAVGQSAKPKISPELWQELREYGGVRVLPQLNVSWRPEQKLSLRERVLQRRAIADGQQRVLTDLAGMRYRVITLPQDRPYLVLDVEQEALATLEASALVAGISRDPNQPTAR